MAASITAARIAFRFSGSDHHLRGLRSGIAANHAKRFLKSSRMRFILR